MNKKQDRRTVQMPTDVYEELCYLQASTRVFLKSQKVEKVLSKTAMTNVLTALIRNADVPKLVKLLK